jgi:hypothetical protein
MSILTMEVLSAIIHCADDWNLLEDLKVRAIPYRISLYADDLVLFVRPNAQDLQLMRSVFSMFEGASSLGCNLAKCQLTLIRCDEGQIQLTLSSFHCQQAEFPVKYLGIPLSVSKLPKSMLQPLADRVIDMLPV